MTLIDLSAELIPAGVPSWLFEKYIAHFMSLVAGQRAAPHLDRSLLNEVFLNHS